MKNFKQTLKLRWEVIREFINFLWKRKLWWMFPMVLVLFIVGMLIISAQATPLAPFVYTLF